MGPLCGGCGGGTGMGMDDDMWPGPMGPLCESDGGGMPGGGCGGGGIGICMDCCGPPGGG